MNVWFLLLCLFISSAESYAHPNGNTEGQPRQFAEEFGARLSNTSKYYIIPIYEIKTTPVKNTCSPMCYKEIYDDPINLLTKSQTSDQFDVIYLAEGLKNFRPQDKNKIFHDISQTVGIVVTKYDFPVKRYPHIIDTGVSKKKSSQEIGEIPYLIITNEKELIEINYDDRYKKVAEIKISNEGIITKINFIDSSDGKSESTSHELSVKKEGIESRSSSEKYNSNSANLEKDEAKIKESSLLRYIRGNLPKRHNRISYDPKSDLEFNRQSTAQPFNPSLPTDLPNYDHYPSTQNVPFSETPNFPQAVSNLPSNSYYDWHFNQFSSVQDNGFYPNRPSESPMIPTNDPYYTNYNNLQQLMPPSTIPQYTSYDIPPSALNISTQNVNHTPVLQGPCSCNCPVDTSFLQNYNNYPVVTSYSSPFGSFFQILNPNPSAAQSPQYGSTPYRNPFSNYYRVPISNFNSIPTQGHNIELSSSNTTSNLQTDIPPIQTLIVNQSTNSTLEKLSENYTETSNLPQKIEEPKLRFPNKIIINNTSVPPENGGPINQHNFTVHITYIPQGSSTTDPGSGPQKNNQEFQPIYSRPQYAVAPQHFGNIPPPYSIPAGYSSAFQPYVLKNVA